MWRPIHVLNLNLLKVKGRSDLFLRLEIIKKILSLIVILITMNFSVMAMCIGSVITSYICLYINTYYTGKLINVGFFLQMRDLLPSFFYATSMGALVYASTFFIHNLSLQLIIGIPLGILYYLAVSVLFKSDELAYVRELLKENIFKKYGKK